MSKKPLNIVLWSLVGILVMLGAFTPFLVDAQYYSYDPSYTNPYYGSSYYPNYGTYPDYSYYYPQYDQSNQYTSYTYPNYSYQYSYQYPYGGYQYPDQYQMYNQYQYPYSYQYPYQHHYKHHQQYPQYTPELNVTCVPSVHGTYVGHYVTWTAYVSGGTGQYEYYWSGEKVQSRNQSAISVAYTTPGTKSATVTVHSGDRNVSRACSPVTIMATPSPYDPWWL